MESTIRTFRPPYKWGHRPTRAPCTFCFCLLISSLFYLTAFSDVASAATYYVDAVDSNDSNLGTRKLPELKQMQMEIKRENVPDIQAIVNIILGM